jgi:hypothetical protein
MAREVFMIYLAPAVLLVLIFCLWYWLKRRKLMQPDEPKVPPQRSNVVITTDKKVDLPRDVKTVTFIVRRNAQGGSEIVAEPVKVELNEGEQLVWTSPSGRLEIRFDPASRPFAGDRYETGRGGRMFSGPLIPQRQVRKAYTYTVLITTKEGTFVAKTFELAVNWRSQSTSK